MPCEEGRHLPLVLFRSEGTGGINHLPARCKESGGVVEDLCAQFGALLHQRFAVLGDGHSFLAEHPLAGTGSIHKDAVKKFRQSGGNAVRILVEDDRIGHAHPFQIALEHLGAGGHELVAHQQPLPAQRGGKLAAFAAGSRAQVQHPHPRPDPQQRRSRGRRRLLRVEDARVVVGVPPRLEGRIFHHKARPAEGRRLHRKVRLCGKGLRRGAQGRDRHAAGSALAGGGVQRIVPLAQQRTFPVLKIFRRHERSSHV